ncbi:MAG: hypothetical protein AAB363_03905 [Planctomycetota bacterium]
MVDADLAELIDNDGDTPAVFGGKDAVKQRGFPSAKKAGENGYRYPVIAPISHLLLRKKAI